MCIRDRISDVAGVSRNTLYYHFSDKYEILDALLKSQLVPVVQPLLTRESWARALEAAAAQLRQDPCLLYTSELAGQVRQIR